MISLFEEKEFLGIDPVVLIIIFGCLSLGSFSLSHMSLITSCRDVVPALSKMVVVIYSFFGGVARILAFLMWFTPSLGLFNLLRHYQVSKLLM